MSSVVALSAYRKPAAPCAMSSEAACATLDDIADAVVGRLNARRAAPKWCYRSPILARGAERNAWVAITRVADDAAMLPEEQLYARMLPDRRVQAGFMVTGPDPDASRAALRPRWARIVDRMGLAATRQTFPRFAIGPVKPILAQVHETCDLRDWIAHATDLKCGRIASVAAYADSATALDGTAVLARQTEDLLMTLSALATG